MSSLATDSDSALDPTPGDGASDGETPGSPDGTGEPVAPAEPTGTDAGAEATGDSAADSGEASGDPLADVLPVEWQAKLWRDVPTWRAVLAALFVGALWVVIVVGLADIPLAAAVLCLVVFASFEELFFPMRYTLTARDATARCVLRVKRMPWTSVKKCYVDGNGIKLSPFDRPTKLETFRGIYLRFDEAAGFTRDRLVPIVKQLRDRAHDR